MPDIRASFADYAAYHQTKGNKWFHRLGIPLIMLTLLGMLARVHIADIARFRIDAAVVLIAIAVVYYFTLEWRLAIAMMIGGVALGLVGLRVRGLDCLYGGFDVRLCSGGRRRS